MDDQLAALNRFRTSLRQFNQSLNGSMKELRRQDEQVKRLWRDSFRRDYDKRWASFSGPVEKYSQTQGARYEKFVDDKIRALNRYLHGH